EAVGAIEMVDEADELDISFLSGGPPAHATPKSSRVVIVQGVVLTRVGPVPFVGSNAQREILGSLSRVPTTVRALAEILKRRFEGPQIRSVMRAFLIPHVEAPGHGRCGRRPYAYYLPAATAEVNT
ncbi:MAG: hypothetical protein SFX73_14080, partial [Kofleriaceae bacterium]|nr:hypothetical protein [Kofleriaceae bacterium]